MPACEVFAHQNGRMADRGRFVNSKQQIIIIIKTILIKDFVD
jgi:hypothetical protein